MFNCTEGQLNEKDGANVSVDINKSEFYFGNAQFNCRHLSRTLVGIPDFPFVFKPALQDLNKLAKIGKVSFVLLDPLEPTYT